MPSLSVSFSPQCLVDSGAWQRVNTQVPIRSPRYAAFDLTEGKLYKFRVLSANIYGNSEPSEPTSSIETLKLKGLFFPLYLQCDTEQRFSQWTIVTYTLLISVVFVILYCLQACHLLPARWFLPGKPTPLSSSSGLLQRNPTIWLATTSTSVCWDLRTGPQPITNLARTPSMFLSWQKHVVLLRNVSFFIFMAYEMLIPLIIFACDSVFAGLWLAVWPKEKPMCSVSRLSMSWVLVKNPRSPHLWLLRLPSVSIILYIWSFKLIIMIIMMICCFVISRCWAVMIIFDVSDCNDKYSNSVLPFQPPPVLLTTLHCWTVTDIRWFSTGRSLLNLEEHRLRSIMWTKDAAEQQCGGRFTSHQS